MRPTDSSGESRRNTPSPVIKVGKDRIRWSGIFPVVAFVALLVVLNFPYKNFSVADLIPSPSPVVAQKKAPPLIGRDGVAIPESSIPANLLEQIRGKNLDEVGPSLVLARVILPADESNKDLGSDLIGKNWHGGLHHELDVGHPGEIAVCITLRDFDHPVSLKLRKLGYKQVALDVPVMHARNAVVWMGDIQLERASDSGVELTGMVKDTSGSLLTAHGNVTLRVNGTPPTLKVPLEAGIFSFGKVAPGDYLVEFWIDHHAVKTWWVTVPPGNKSPIKSQHVAHPRKKVALRVDTSQTRGAVVKFEAGIPYAESYLDLAPGKQLRVSQAGRMMQLYSNEYLLAVIKHATADADQARQMIGSPAPWHSWEGVLEAGDTIVLLSKGDRVGALVRVVSITP